MKVAWFVALFSAICLEGLGRKYLPAVPSVAFYFLKDVVLIIGYFRFRPPLPVRKMQRYLYRGFESIWFAGLGWTLLQMFNPEHQSFQLALLGIRAYWLWWMAPPIIAGVLMNPRHKGQAIYALIIMAVGISAFAAVQFVSPADSAVNLYTVRGGQEIYAADSATVATTGRARVASTFSFLSGFADFTVLIPVLLLSMGLEAKDRRLRRSALFATLATAAVVPMAGSRGSVLAAALVLLIALWSAGLFFTRFGRRILLGGIVAVFLSLFAFPDAMIGVSDRFGREDETARRFAELANFLPPVALLRLEYPTFGIGTGMMQNARMTAGVSSKWEAEGEVHRLLIELGPIGFLLVWIAKLGLMIALFRAYQLLKKAGRRGAASAALTYAVLTIMGNLVFDHVYQALYFVGCGFVLAEVTSLMRAQSPPGVPARAEPAAPPPVVTPATT